MNRKQFLLTLSVAMISGFLGGTFGIWFLMPRSVLAQDSPQTVIEAQEFRVVDDEGNNRAILGITPESQVGLYLLDSLGNSRTQISTEADGGGNIAIRDKTGIAAFAVAALEGEKSSVPVMTFIRDEYFATLGASGISFSKSFNAHISISVQKDAGPSLSLKDNLGKIRAVLGTTNLKHPDTGSTEIRAPSSLVLFDEEGSVVWSAP